MPTVLRLLFITMLFVLGGDGLQAAERQRFKLGAGGGFSFSGDPVLDLPIVGTVGGFIGYRFNDNWSIEGGFYFAQASGVFLADGTHIDTNTYLDTDRLDSHRLSYNAEGTLIFNIGRRKQFHPFLLVGGGASRREDKTRLLSPGATTLPPVVTVSEHVPTVHFGAGFDIYFRYNVSVRGELRYTLPDFDKNIRAIRSIFGATYFF